MKIFIQSSCLIWAFCFARIGVSQAQPNITRVEYYVNTDPGFGLGTAIPITPATNLPNLSFNLNISSYPIGLTMVGIRSRDANGAWSHDNRWLIAKLPQQTNVPAITRTEYYVNNDPGYGNGTVVPTYLDGSGSFMLNITDQPIGLTMVGIRSRDANGAWSHDNRWLIAKLPMQTIPAIQRVEYYFDNDPGYGKGIPLAIPKATNLPGLQINANITGLSAGKHKIFYRTLDSLGQWSHDNVDSFVLAAAQPAPQIVVNSINGKAAYCAGDSLTIGFHATGSYAANNMFRAYLSNAEGSFATEVEIGIVQSAVNGTINCKLPMHIPTGSAYKIRVKSSNTIVVGEPNGSPLTIRDRPYGQTITGRIQVNGGFTYPYNVSAVAGSNFKWLIEGGSQASGAATNAITTLWGNPASDSVNRKMQVIETNQYGCVGDTGTLTPVTVYRLDIGDTTSVSVCKGDMLVVKAGITGSFDAGNILTAQLSNASGNFNSPTATTTLAYSGSGVNQLATFNLPIPGNLPNGNGYRVRIRSSLPVFIGDTTDNIAIQKPNVGADITAAYCAGQSYNLTQHFTSNALTYTYFTQAYAPVVNPAMVLAGVFQVIGKNSFGCPDTAMVTISTLPKPSLGADTTVYHVCAGETTNLLPLYNTASLTAVWNTGNPSSVGPGTYRLIVTNTQGCTDTAFANIVLPTAIWTGAVSTNWHTAGNWNTGKVPDAATHVIIATSTPRICIVSTADGLAASVQVKNGATLQQTNGRQVVISGQCNVLPSQ